MITPIVVCVCTASVGSIASAFRVFVINTIGTLPLPPFKRRLALGVEMSLKIPLEEDCPDPRLPWFGKITAPVLNQQ